MIPSCDARELLSLTNPGREETQKRAPNPKPETFFFCSNRCKSERQTRNRRGEKQCQSTCVEQLLNMKGSQEDEVERENENVFLDSSSPLRLDSFRVKQADFERNILIMTILSARKKNSSKMPPRCCHSLSSSRKRANGLSF